MEEFALRSHQRAVRAIDEGRFEREIAPYGEVTADEGPRRDTTLEKMAGLKPLVEGGTLTAAVSSQVSDGAAAMLLASERAVREHGLTPRARVHHLSVRGEDPIRMLSAPDPGHRARPEEGRHGASTTSTSSRSTRRSRRSSWPG